MLYTIIGSTTALVVGFAGGYIIRRMTAEAAIGSAEAEAKRILDAARRDAEGAKREALVEAREEAQKMRAEIDREAREQRNELQRMERRLAQKEETLDRKLDASEKREQALKRQEAALEQAKAEIEEMRARQAQELERISGMTQEEAKELLLRQVREETRLEAAQLARSIELEAKEQAEEKAKEIIAAAVQRCAADFVSEITVSLVELPNEEMKGRIIGREGRNIRAFEALTGVDLIIDDTPEAVVISSFEPIRREKARLTLDKLVADGRIHPGRIEEMYHKSERELENIIRQAGEEAAYQAGVNGLHPELVRILGRLKYRTSYGQNVLKHSIEVAMLAAAMATELNVDVNVARRAGLLHDIGKALDHEMEGTHIEIGMDLLKKYGESPAVIHAMSTHHGDFEAESVEAVLVTAADALSAARPGARRETLEAYIRRLEKLEEIAESYKGVEKSYAIQAGREIRILVKPDEIDDAMAYQVVKDIVKRIEEEVQYPGQIKVTVIRETRAVEYAR